VAELVALLYTEEMVLVVVQEVAVQVMLVEQEQAVLELADKVMQVEHQVQTNKAQVVVVQGQLVELVVQVQGALV
jgi:hypothetical protein